MSLFITYALVWVILEYDCLALILASSLQIWYGKQLQNYDIILVSFYIATLGTSAGKQQLVFTYLYITAGQHLTKSKNVINWNLSENQLLVFKTLAYACAKFCCDTTAYIWVIKLEIVDQWSTRIPPLHRRGWHCSKSQGSHFKSDIADNR